METKKTPLVSKTNALSPTLNNLSASQISLQSFASNSALAKSGLTRPKHPKPVKPQPLARNQQQRSKVEQEKKLSSTKTIQISLGQMMHSYSQSSLQSQPKYIGNSKGDVDDNDGQKKLQDSFTQQSGSQTARSRQSPSPPRFMATMDKRLSYLSNATLKSQQIKAPIYHQKQRSLDKHSSKTRNINKTVQSQSKQSLMPLKTTVSEVSAKAHIAKNTHQIQQHVKSKPTRPSINTNQLKSKERKTLQATKNVKSYSNLISTSIQSPSIIGSPKYAMAAQNSGISSLYSMTTDSLANSSMHGKEKKMTLSEKLAPKVKKKQKQPKQISISRDQLHNNSQAASAYTTTENHRPQQQHQQQQVILPQQQNQAVISTTVLSKTESIQSSQQLHSKNMVESTPVTNYNEMGDDQEFIQIFQRDVPSPRALFSQEELKIKSQDVFSFIAQSAARSLLHIEELKSSGVLPEHYQDTLGNANQSIDGLHEKKSTQEVATPVFQGHNRKFSEQRPSDAMLHLNIKITDESPKVILNEDKIKPKVRVRHQDIQTEKNLDESINTISSLQADRVLKKVYSTNDLGLSQSYQSVRLQQDQQMKRNPSNGGFFKRLRSLFRGGKSDQNDQQQPEVTYQCKCGSSGKPYACVRAMKWLQSSNNYSEQDYDKNRLLYEGLNKVQVSSGSENQIERDIPRTFTSTDSFMNSYEGQQKLSRVLNAFSQYFRAIGYVQGMNFIVGALLLHCSEDIAFWLFVSLIEDYEMRDIYQPRLPGLYKHSQILQLLQMEHLPSLHQHFCKHNILIEMYASDWIFALFSNIIPLTEYHHFLDQFFIGGWSFFYKFSLSFLKSLQEEVICQWDISEILTIIKLKFTKQDKSNDTQSIALQFDTDLDSIRIQSDTATNSPSKNAGQFKSIISKIVFGRGDAITSESFRDDSVWEKLVSLSIKEWEDEYNDGFVQNLLSNFDPDKLIFRSTVNTPRRSSVNSSPNRGSIIKRNASVGAYERTEKVVEVVKASNVPQSSRVQIIVTEKSIKNPRNQRTIVPQNGRATLQPKNTRSLQSRELKSFTNDLRRK